MMTRRSAFALIGIASCVASFLAGVAYAGGFVPASARESAISVVACIDDDVAVDPRAASFSEGASGD